MKVIILISLIISAFIAVECGDPAPTAYIVKSLAECTSGLAVPQAIDYLGLSTKAQTKTCADTLVAFMNDASKKYRSSGLDCVADFYDKASQYSFIGIDKMFDKFANITATSTSVVDIDGRKRAVQFCTILKVLKYAGTSENVNRTAIPIKVTANADEALIEQNFNYNSNLTVRLVEWAADQLRPNDTVWADMHTEISNQFYRKALPEVKKCILKISDRTTRLLAFLTMIRDLILTNNTAASRVEPAVVDDLMKDMPKPAPV